MLRHGRLLICVVAVPLVFCFARGPDADRWRGTPSGWDVADSSLNPPDPSPVLPIEPEIEQWKNIVELLCLIVPCDPNDPGVETVNSATACLHLRLDRFEIEGLNPGLEPDVISSSVENVGSLAAILQGPDWHVFAPTSAERDRLIAQLDLLLDSLLAEAAASERPT